MDNHDHDHRTNLRQQHVRRLQHLECQAARTGATTDPAIQIEIADLRSTLAALDAPADGLPAPPPPLPLPLTPLLGREDLLTHLHAQLHDPTVRFLTLAGPGGIGKTRLALHVAWQMQAAMPDGVIFVALDALQDAQLVLPTIAQALGIHETTPAMLLTHLQTVLGARHMLLILDNIEHVLVAAPLLGQLVQGAPRLRVLATSRVVLQLTGEVVIKVPPLDLPVTPSTESLAALESYGAIQLFIDRVQAIHPHFRLTSTNAPAIATICQRLEGVPLALELAAARCRVLTPQDLLTRLDQRLNLLTSGPCDLPPRQRTLRATIDWSYQLLPVTAQTLLARLSIFAGGCDLAAATAICLPAPSPDAGLLEDLTTLVNAHLLLHDHVPTQDDTIRFTMPDTIHAYAQEQRRHLQETAIQQRHARYYLALAEDVAPLLMTAHQTIGVQRLRLEHDNLRAALSWASQHDPALCLRLGTALWFFWLIQGYLSEGIRWLTLALDQTDSAPTSLRAQALVGRGRLAFGTGDYEHARTCYQEAITISEHVDDPLTRAFAQLFGLSTVIGHVDGDHGAARVLYQESLRTFQSIQHAWGIAAVLHDMALGWKAEGHYDTALRLLEASVCHSPRDAWAWGIIQVNLGRLHQLQHNYPQACACYIGSLRRVHPQTIWYAEMLTGLAGIALAYVAPVLAARWLGTATARYEAIELCIDPDEVVHYQQHLAAARTQLGEAAFTAAWQAGRTLTMPQVIIEAQTLYQHITGADDQP